jgi:hypothetical protein
MMMNPYKKEKLIWFLLGGVVGMVLTFTLECCTAGPPPPPVAPPSPPACADAGVAADAAADADDAAPPAQTPLAFDAGPSCGTHPWCKDKHPCCTSPGNCCG